MEADKETMGSYSSKQIAKRVADFCLGKYRFIFVSGNGGAGKTTFAKDLVSEITSRSAEVNYIDTDEFVLDTKMRKSAKKVWIDAEGNAHESEYTTSFRESYYLNAVEAIIYSLNKGQNCYFKLKKGNQFVEVKTEASLTIIEGVGSAFLEKNKETFGIFLMCDRAVEISRRIDRARDGEENLSREEIEKKCIERDEQFRTMVLPERKKFDLEFSSGEDYSLTVARDDFNLFQS